MPVYINTRIRNINNNWVVQVQRHDHPDVWDWLHPIKCPCPEMSQIIRHMAKSEASKVAQDLSRRTNEQVICYDEHDNIVSVFVNGRNIKFFRNTKHKI